MVKVFGVPSASWMVFVLSLTSPFLPVNFLFIESPSFIPHITSFWESLTAPSAASPSPAWGMMLLVHELRQVGFNGFIKASIRPKLAPMRQRCPHCQDNLFRHGS